MNDELVQLIFKLTLGLVNYTLERAQYDPVIMQKIARGEPLTMADLRRLDDGRRAAAAETDALIGGDNV